MNSDEKASLGLLAALVAMALAGSAIDPFDRLTWWLEVAPVLMAAPVLWLTRRRWPLTPLLYTVIGVHALVLIVGGAYSYARVPLGFWLQDAFELSRNPYDKIGHFFQGVTPALLAREILLRGGWLGRGRMLGFLAVCVALAFSAFYELIEWAAALALGQGAEEFLGTQGDFWDTQSDMAMALLGATLAVLLLGPKQDRELGKTGRG
ncbi:MAG: DUF2238 domain-containing protein [Burkholderiaceae bacterium]